jgi:hypothetical protein
MPVKHSARLLIKNIKLPLLTVIQFISVHYYPITGLYKISYL